MSLEIEIDPHGIARTAFNEMRDQLLAEGKTFTERELRKLPYHQIRLAAIANAGTAACSLADMIAEKQRRRSRFLAASPDLRSQAARYLATEGMLGDVNAAIEARSAVRFNNCTTRNKLWLKLNCLHNHTDLPQVRLKEAYKLAWHCMSEGSLEEEIAKRFQWDLEHLVNFYPHGLTSEQLRSKVGTMAEELLDLLNDAEWSVCGGDVVVDYSCTSDCYRTI